MKQAIDPNRDPNFQRNIQVDLKFIFCWAGPL